MLRSFRSYAPIILALAVLAWGTPMAAAAVPTATFAPATGAVNIALNANITITFSEAVRKINDTALFADDLEDLVTLKVTNAAGAAVDFQPFINAGKTIITINPVANLNPSQAYYVAIGATVENATDEAIAPTAITFTTGPLTEITGTSDGLEDFSVTANENVAIGATVTTVTTQGAGTPSFSLSATLDFAKFSIDAATGALSFTESPNFEIPTDTSASGFNTYRTNVRVRYDSNTPADATDDTQEVAVIQVTIANVDEFNPAITSNGGLATAAITINEGATEVTTVTATGDGTPVFSLNGGADVALFAVTGAGALTVTARDFETPQDLGATAGNNTYVVVVRATDADNETVDQTLTISIADVDEVAPTLSASGISGATSSGGTLTFTSSEVGTYYYLIQNSAGADPADAAAVEAGATASAAALAAANTIPIGGLTASTNYEVFVVVKDGANNRSAVVTLNFATLTAVVVAPQPPPKTPEQIAAEIAERKAAEERYAAEVAAAARAAAEKVVAEEKARADAAIKLNVELAEAKITAVAQTKNQLAPLKSANASLNKALADLDALLKPSPDVVAPRIDLAERFAGKRITIQREVIRNGKTTLVNVGTFLLDSRGNVVLSKSLKITRGTKLRVSAPGESVTRITAK
jgi:methionine-rich copper-binding protein CopC